MARGLGEDEPAPAPSQPPILGTDPTPWKLWVVAARHDLALFEAARAQPTKNPGPLGSGWRASGTMHF
jgi:hypothetical protein